MLSHLKTFIILFLAAFAVYLTAVLWFSEISGSSFTNAMLGLFSRAQPEVDVEHNFFVKPAKIITSFGDGRFDIMYNNIDTSTQKRSVDDAIMLALDSGEYSGIEEDLNELLSAEGYAYCYAASVPSNVFVNSYPQRRNVFTSRVRAFDWVFVRPYDDSVIGVVFLDTDGRAHEYRIADYFLNQRLSESITQRSGGGNRLKYTYERGFFIPQVEGYVYPLVLMENQYMDQGGLLLDYIERKVDVFFGSAGSKMATPTQLSFTYSDENTVVKYFPSESQNGLDTLEYAYYSVLDSRILTTLSADYNTAVRFITRDTTIVNEYYLAAVTESGSRRSFCFNYAINDLPISMSYSSASQTGLEYPIEITVENGVVTRYRKLVYEFVVDTSATVTAVTTFRSVLNDLLAIGESPDELPLDAVAFGYKIDTSEPALYWFVEMGGMTYLKSAQAVANP